MIQLPRTPLSIAMLSDGAVDPQGESAPSGEAARGRAARLADLLPRLASGLVLATAALTAVWQGGAIFALVWFGAALAVGLEWQNLIGARRLRLRFALTTAALAIACYCAAQGRLAMACGALGLAGVAIAVAAGRGRRLWAFAGVAYAGSLLISVFALYAVPGLGLRAIFWLFATVWGTDIFAYFGGRLIGGPKLWPQVSPSKTWAGTLCGVFAGALIGVAIGTLGLEGAPAAPVFALGLAAALVAQTGDILKSTVKRRFGAKDSSTLIPGHGGFMDRLDGFIAAAAFLALFAALDGLAAASGGPFSWL